MRTIFFNAKILPMDGDTELFCGTLETDGDRIAALYPDGAERACERSPSEVRAQSDEPVRRIDCGGNLLLPGFKNAHTHSGMTFLRSKADDLSLHDWLYDCVFPRERLLKEGDCYWLTKLAILEYLSGGTTAMFDMYMFRDDIVRAALETGFRTVIVNAVNDFGGSAAEELDEYARYTKLGPLISYQFGVHAEYTTNIKILKDLADMLRTVKKPFYSHMNETADEVQSCLDVYKKRPFELFDELGLFDYGGGGFHCVHVNDREMEIIKNRGLYVITCPGSNTKLASGVAPVYEYLEQGVPVAIGTDGPASNNCLDMFREMFLVTGLQKLRRGPDVVDAHAVLTMACCTGARAMGLADCDCLAVGKKADLVLLDLDQPNMRPQNNIPKNIVYSGSKQNVLLTMVGGRVLYERGAFHIGEDPARIYAEAEKIVRRIG